MTRKGVKASGRGGWVSPQGEGTSLQGVGRVGAKGLIF